MKRCFITINESQSFFPEPRGITAMREWFDKHWTEWHPRRVASGF